MGWWRSGKQAVLGQVLQSRPAGVLLGKLRIVQRPLDADVRIVPRERQFILRIVKFRAFVGEQGGLAQHRKAMRETRRDEELPFVLGREIQSMPPAKRGRTAPDVHRHVKHLALQHKNQLALGRRILEMQPAQGARAATATRCPARNSSPAPPRDNAGGSKSP